MQRSFLYRYVVIAVIGFLFVSCGRSVTSLSSWNGHSKESLLKSIGQPTRITSDGNGGEILHYENTNLVTFSDYIVNYHHPAFLNLADVYCNKDGIIYYSDSRQLETH
jgi:hypothetical protein